MPFRSEAQRRFMYARHPDIAKRWTQEYGSKVEPSGKRKRGTASKRGFLSRVAEGYRGQ